MLIKILITGCLVVVVTVGIHTLGFAALHRNCFNVKTITASARCPSFKFLTMQM